MGHSCHIEEVTSLSSITSYLVEALSLNVVAVLLQCCCRCQWILLTNLGADSGLTDWCWTHCGCTWKHRSQLSQRCITNVGQVNMTITHWSSTVVAHTGAPWSTVGPSQWWEPERGCAVRQWSSTRHEARQAGCARMPRCTGQPWTLHPTPCVPASLTVVTTQLHQCVTLNIVITYYCSYQPISLHHKTQLLSQSLDTFCISFN